MEYDAKGQLKITACPGGCDQYCHNKCKRHCKFIGYERHTHLNVWILYDTADNSPQTTMCKCVSFISDNQELYFLGDGHESIKYVDFIQALKKYFIEKYSISIKEFVPTKEYDFEKI